MRRALMLPVLAAACVAAQPATRAEFLSDATRCGMPAVAEATGPVLRLDAQGFTPAVLRGGEDLPTSCSWNMSLDLETLGMFKRAGRCYDERASGPALFLITVAEAQVTVESDYPTLRKISFARCPVPGPIPEPVSGPVPVPALDPAPVPVGVRAALPPGTGGSASGEYGLTGVDAQTPGQ